MPKALNPETTTGTTGVSEFQLIHIGAALLRGINIPELRERMRTKRHGAYRRTGVRALADALVTYDRFINREPMDR